MSDDNLLNEYDEPITTQSNLWALILLTGSLAGMVGSLRLFVEKKLAKEPFEKEFCQGVKKSLDDIEKQLNELRDIHSRLVYSDSKD